MIRTSDHTSRFSLVRAPTGGPFWSPAIWMTLSIWLVRKDWPKSVSGGHQRNTHASNSTVLSMSPSLAIDTS